MARPPEHPDDSAAFRTRLRRQMLAARAALAQDPSAHADASNRLRHHLSALLRPLPPASIGFCPPVRGEADITPLIHDLLALGWQASMPVVVAAAAPMVFRHWTPEAPMSLDRHGIPIPETNETSPPAVLLLPLVAFDLAGYRLGYGGGYFDRTLAVCVPRPRVIGVGFECGRCATIHPLPHDQRCDTIVSDAGIMTLS